MSETNLDVIVERLENLKQQNEKDHDEMREAIATVLAEQRKTNGSITSLKLTRAWMKGAIAVLTAIVVPVAFILIQNYFSK